MTGVKKENTWKQSLRFFFRGETSTLAKDPNLAWFAFFFVLIMGIVLFIPLIVFNKGYFIYYGDFNAQQISFYRMAHDAVRGGDFGWNWTTDLGVNFIGSYSFYLLGSPFFWLTIPFPSAAVPYLMAPLLILKLAFMGLTSYLYLSRFVRSNYAVVGAIMYAFSGFSIYNVFFNHFHEAMIYLPFILYALERYMVEDKKGLFAIAVCLSALNNYYFFIGQVVFLLIYWIIRLTSGCWKTTPRKIICLFIEAIIGTMAAAVLLLPSFYSVIQNSRASNLVAGRDAMIFSQPQRLYDIIHCFFFPSDIPARPNFFPDAQNQWGSMSAWIPLIGCTGAIAYFQSYKHKDWLHRLYTVLVIMALVPFFNSIFQLLNWQYYARWFYMLTLMLILGTLIMISHPKQEQINWKRAFGWSGGITAFFVIFIGLMPKSFKDDPIKIGLEQYTDRFWIYVGIVVVGLVISYLLLQYKKQNEKAFVPFMAFSLCIVSLVYSWYTLSLGQSTSSYNSKFVVERAIRGIDKVEMPVEEWNRIDVHDCMDNLGIYWELPCIQTFHSVVPGSIMEFYESIGVKRSVASRPETSHYALRGLLSTKYVFDYADDEEPIINRGSGKKFVDEYGNTKAPGYHFAYKTNGFNVYQNDNYIPMGFTYDSYILRSEYDAVQETDREFLLLKTLVIEDGKEAEISRILPKLDVNAQYYDYDMYVLDCEERRKETASEFTPSSKGFTATISLQKENAVFFSVPYEPNAWSVKVNGEPATFICSNVGFMSVVCPQGTSKIEFTYHTPGLMSGITLTCIAIFLWNMYIVISDRKTKKKEAQSAESKDESVEEA